MHIRLMIRTYNAAGWETIHGGGWSLHQELEPGIVSAIEGRRFSHFDGTENLRTEMWILDYHFNPGIRFRTEHSKWQKRKPDVWHLYPPNVAFHHDTRRSAIPLHAIWIRFHGAEKLGLKKLIEAPLRMAIFADPEGWLLEKIRSLAFLRDAHGEENYADVAVVLMDVIRRLLQSRCESPGHYKLSEIGETRRRDPLVEKVDQYLVAHLHESVTLDQMASDLHTSMSTLKRHYATASTHSIKQALTHLRIGRVKRLLMQGATVAEAADMTGFFDPFHLSRTFKHIVGVPPRTFLARQKQAPPKLVKSRLVKS